MPGGNSRDCLEGRGMGQKCVWGDHFNRSQAGKLQEPGLNFKAFLVSSSNSYYLPVLKQIILNRGALEVWPRLFTPTQSKVFFPQQLPLRPSLLTGPLQLCDSTNHWTNHFCFPTQSHLVRAWCLQNSRSVFAAWAPCPTPLDFMLSVLQANSLFSMAKGHAAASLQLIGHQALPSGWSWIPPPDHLHQVVVTSTRLIRSPGWELTHQFPS